jgi:hypothetical protein
VPFRDIISLEQHFQDHKHEFGVATKEDYEKMADEFMFGNMNPATHQCVRINDVSVRLDFVNRHFGTAEAARRIIWTFHIVTESKITKAGGPMNYLDKQCRRAS